MLRLPNPLVDAKTCDIAMLAPQRRELLEVSSITQRVGQENAVYAARGGSADDIDDDVRIRKSFHQRENSLATNSAEELGSNTVDVDCQRYSSIQH